MPHPMTPQGAEKMRRQLEKLIKVARPNIIKSISEARAFGDLKENAEYHAAKEKQGFIEAKIKDIEARLSDLQVIDINNITNDGKVIFGSKVTLIDLETDKEISYQIVGEYETDLDNNIIAYNTPIAKALVGQYIEDIVTVKTPGGTVEYEIVKVDY